MKTPTHPSYSQDEAGQWWYTAPRNGVRTRCKIKTCERCGEEFVAAAYQTKRRFCGRKCSNTMEGRTYLRGADSPMWTGGRQKARGYVKVYAPDHPSVQGKYVNKRYVFEHRLVMEQVLGR